MELLKRMSEQNHLMKLNRAGALLTLGFLLVASTAAADNVARGRVLYLRNCASCHGVTGDGRGPVAPALKTPPADLRLLSRRYGDPLPEDQIARFIDGRADIAAHGPRDMPVWGDQVWQYPPGKGPSGQVTSAVADLVAYLESIQELTHHVSFP
jgi:mono/diheme cytochrome c family protein